jgi:hypothetical protein
LATIWRTLEGTKEEIGPLAKLQAMWRGLPAPGAGQRDAARTGADEMRDYVVRVRAKIANRFEPPSTKSIRSNAEPFLIWRNREYASHRLDYERSALQVEGEAAPVSKTMPKADSADDASALVDGEGVPHGPKRSTAPDPDLQVPAGQRAACEAAFARFSSAFPDAFYISERGRYFPDNTRDKGRYLSAGFHNLMGYFRDDQPLYDLILDPQGRKQLDELWKELDFVASANSRTYVQFYLFESRAAAKAPADGGRGLGQFRKTQA